LHLSIPWNRSLVPQTSQDLPLSIKELGLADVNVSVFATPAGAVGLVERSVNARRRNLFGIAFGFSIAAKDRNLFHASDNGNGQTITQDATGADFLATLMGVPLSMLFPT
jgi:hypothetical protein